MTSSEELRGRVVGVVVEERGEVGVDEQQVDVGLLDAHTSLGDELLDRSQTHRQRQQHEGGAGQPHRLHGDDEVVARRPEDGDMGTHADASGLECGGDRLGLEMELVPAAADLDAVADEGDATGAATIRGGFDSVDEGGHALIRPHLEPEGFTGDRAGGLRRRCSPAWAPAR